MPTIPGTLAPPHNTPCDVRTRDDPSHLSPSRSGGVLSVVPVSPSLAPAVPAAPGTLYDLTKLQLRVGMLEGANQTLVRRMDTVAALHEAELRRLTAEFEAQLEAERRKNEALQAELESVRQARRDDVELRKRTGPAARQMLVRMQGLEEEVEHLRGRVSAACDMSPRVRKAFIPEAR